MGKTTKEAKFQISQAINSMNGKLDKLTDLPGKLESQLTRIQFKIPELEMNTRLHDLKREKFSCAV